MKTSHLPMTTARIALAMACLISSVSCGGELLRTGRSPVYLTVSKVEAAKGDDTANFTAFLLSDVQTLIDVTNNGVTTKVATVFNDNARVTLRVDSKNTVLEPTRLNSVTVTRYHVNFRRADGKNTPGVDVPYSFDGASSLTISAGDTADLVLELIRHQAKLEPPLKQLVNTGGLGFISTIAEITVYARDQNGNDMQVTASMDVQFADFADKTS